MAFGQKASSCVVTSNGSQLPKMKKVEFLHVPAIKFVGWKQMVYISPKLLYI